jgi:hypothetical protein
MILLPKFVSRFFSKSSLPGPESGIPRIVDPIVEFNLLKEQILRESQRWRFFRAYRLRRRIRAAWRQALLEHEKIISRAIVRGDRQSWLARPRRGY